jgi:GTP-binding protein HflX
MAEVQRVLAEIGAGEVPQVVVFNKLDRMDETERPRDLRDAIELPSGERVTRVFVSAKTGEGLDLLRTRIAEATAVRVDGDLNANAEPSVDGLVEPATGDQEAGADETVRTGTYHSHA